jgi:3-oxoacyl-[acyl-carrier protein] reductase
VEGKLDLSGKVAIVTGAGQGIGKAVALELARVGADIVATGRTKEKLDSVGCEIQGIGRRFLAVRMDVSRWEDARRMADVTFKAFRRIDILVNNAGINPKGEGGIGLKIQDIAERDWDHVMNVNLKGAFNCAKAVMPFMIDQKSGRIVNISSVTGLTGGAGSPASAHYFVSKGAILCLTKALARELAPHNINVNAIAPGMIVTEMVKVSDPRANERVKRETPLRRFGDPIDVARAVLYLVCESGDFIAGETLILDGGRTMH